MGFRTELALQNNTCFLAVCVRYRSTESDYVDFFPLSSVSHGDHYDISTPVQSKLLCRDWKITAIMGLRRTDNSTAGFEHTKKIRQAFLKTQGVTSSIPSQTSSEFQSPPVWTHRTHLVKARWISWWGVTISSSPIKKISLSQTVEVNRWTPWRTALGFVSALSSPKTPLRLISSQLHFHQTQRERSQFCCALCP